MFQDLLIKINNFTPLGFDEASLKIAEYVNSCENFIDLLKQIGTIPESIEFDSTQEKLFSKASDAVLARAFRKLGLKSTILKERGNAADVQAESIYHNYSLVADAKAFRLSRTAKNQKDFKVVALSGWRNDADYAVLCAPYFQYPLKQSQIYAQAVEHNVCLLSWEHIIFLIENDIKETTEINLSSLWDVSEDYAQRCVVAERNKCFISEVNEIILRFSQKDSEEMKSLLETCRNNIIERAETEKAFWREETARIMSLTREQAISELVKAKKIDEKIAQIEKYIAGIKI